MVKKTGGGSKHKKQARKRNASEAVSRKTRLKNPAEPCEMYAIVTNNYGQGNCEVLCNDGKKRMCVIRNKFRGRNKRGNKVDTNVRVLVGLREWAIIADGKKEKCDLLEVYNSREIEDIKKDPNYDAKLLRTEEEKMNDHRDGTSNFEFERDDMFAYEDEGEGGEREEGSASSHLKELDEIDIDDI